MKQITIDNSHSNIVCYDAVNMYHANDSQIIKLNNENHTIIEILCKLWGLNKNESIVYETIANKIVNEITPNKKEIIKYCADNNDKNKITYTRAIDSLKEKGIIYLDLDGDIFIHSKYNIFNYLKNRNKETIKFITIKL